MKKLLFAIALWVAFGGGMMAQKTTTEVDAEGVKVVVLDSPGTLKKLIGKKEIPLVKKLEINGKMSDEDFRYLQKLTSLEVIDFSNSHIEISDLQTYLENGKDHYYDTYNIPHEVKMPSVKAIVVGARAKRGLGMSFSEKGKFFDQFKEHIKNSNGINRDIMLFSYYFQWMYQDFSDFTLYRRVFPNLVKFATANVIAPYRLSFDVPEKLYVAGFGDLQPIVLFEHGMIIYDLESKKETKDCHIVFAGSDGQDLDNAIFLSTATYGNGHLGKLVVPPSLKYICNVDTQEGQMNVDTLVIQDGDDFLIIDDQAFGKSELKEFTSDRPVYICSNAFASSKPKTVTFNKDVVLMDNAFHGYSYPLEVRFNGGVRKLGSHVFDGAESVVFSSVPQDVAEGATKNFARILVPTGTAEAFSQVGITDNVFETSDGLFHGLTYDIQVEKPGTILSYLPLDKLAAIDSLTITGFLYETDLQIISKCTFLTYLDISKTFTTVSPEFLKKIDERNKEISVIASLMGAAAEMEYQDGNISTMEHEIAKAMSELVKEAYDVKASNDDCSVVYLSGLKYLKTVKLPYRAAKIVRAIDDCPSLEYVELPKYLKMIGSWSFENCPNLKSITFPETVYFIDEKSFAGCTGLTEVDMSNITTAEKSMEIMMKNCTNLKFIKYPKGLKRLERLGGGEQTVHIFSDEIASVPFQSGKVYHLKNQTPPKNSNSYDSSSYPSGMTLYIPKGCTTSYYTTMGSGNKYIEE